MRVVVQEAGRMPKRDLPRHRGVMFTQYPGGWAVRGTMDDHWLNRRYLTLYGARMAWDRRTNGVWMYPSRNGWVPLAGWARRKGR